MTIPRALSRIRDIARMNPRAGLLLKVAAVVLIAVLAAGCTVQVSLPSAGASGGQGSSQSSNTTTTSSSSCSTCNQLMSQFPVLAAIGLSELEDLLDKYGPDVTVLLWVAAVILDL